MPAQRVSHGQGVGRTPDTLSDNADPGGCNATTAQLPEGGLRCPAKHAGAERCCVKEVGRAAGAHRPRRLPVCSIAGVAVGPQLRPTPSERKYGWSGGRKSLYRNNRCEPNDPVVTVCPLSLMG